MGDPRRIRNKYAGPSHPWNKQRIEEESKLAVEYGVKNRTELWRARSQLKDFTDQAKRLIAGRTHQSEREKSLLIAKLYRLGLISESSAVDSVLNLSLGNVLERRLQTQIVRKGLARTMKQARQFITHKHIIVGGKIITSPSFLVGRQDEANLQFVANSSFVSPEHPERTVVKK